MHHDRIDVLLPWQERFEPSAAGAVALCVRDNVQASRLRENTRVLGRWLKQPFAAIEYQEVYSRYRWLLGRARSVAAGYLAVIGDDYPALLEIDNRPLAAHYIAMRQPFIPILLYLHNDPQNMKGAKSVAERRALLRCCSAIVCVSNYIRQRFLAGLRNENAAKVHTVITGIDRPWRHYPEKQALIIFAGRILPEKGALEFAQALKNILPRYPQWSAVIAGTRKFGSDSPSSGYERRVREKLYGLESQVRTTGYIPHDRIMDWYGRAAIAVVPSIWPEPLGRTALEALAAGCALITTDRGGLPEVAANRGIVMPAADSDELTRHLEALMQDESRRRQWQDKAWSDYPFTVTNMVQQLDDIKESIMIGRDQSQSTN